MNIKSGGINVNWWGRSPKIPQMRGDWFSHISTMIMILAFLGLFVFIIYWNLVRG